MYQQPIDTTQANAGRGGAVTAAMFQYPTTAAATTAATYGTGAPAQYAQYQQSAGMYAYGNPSGMQGGFGVAGRGRGGRGGGFPPQGAGQGFGGGFGGGRGGGMMFGRRKKPFVGGTLETQRQWEQNNLCCFHLQGGCKFGDGCRFSHEDDGLRPCQFGANCRMGHQGRVAGAQQPQQGEGQPQQVEQQQQQQLSAEAPQQQ